MGRDLGEGHQMGECMDGLRSGRCASSVTGSQDNLVWFCLIVRLTNLYIKWTLGSVLLSQTGKDAAVH